jgi:hypothetical protein
VLGAPLLDNVPVDQSHRVHVARGGRRIAAELMLPLIRGGLL